MGKEEKNYKVYRRRVAFEDVIDVAKKRLAEENISFDEIERNIGVDSEFCRILFDPQTRTSANISAIFKFLRINLGAYTAPIYTYRVEHINNYIRVKRMLAPKAVMYYNRLSGKFYKFSYRLKSEYQSKVYTDIIKNEMADAVNKYLEERAH